MFRFSPIFFRQLRDAAAASLLLLCAGHQQLAAEPLDKEACDKLKVEKQGLMVLGVDQEFAKGPDWAKSNLTPPELDLIKHFISVEEQLKFRCGMAVVHLQVQNEPDEADEESAPAAAGTVPVPHRRNQANTAKPAGGAARSEPAAAKPAKPVAKPAPKAQSSWNTETTPVDANSPTAIDQLNTQPAPARNSAATGGRG
jgi:hypothetical protein